MSFTGHVEAEDLVMLQRVLDEHCAAHGDDEPSRKMAAKALLHFFQVGHNDPDALARQLAQWRGEFRQGDEA